MDQGTLVELIGRAQRADVAARNEVVMETMGAGRRGDGRRVPALSAGAPGGDHAGGPEAFGRPGADAGDRAVPAGWRVVKVRIVPAEGSDT